MREVFHTENAPGAIGPYSQGVRMNGFVFASGQGGLIPGTKEFAGDTVEAQTEQVLKNIAAILHAGGTDMAHVVKTLVLLADIADLDAFRSVYTRFFPTDYPACSAYAVKDIPLGALVEIEAIAVIPE